MQIYFHSRLWSYLPRVPILVEGTVAPSYQRMLKARVVAVKELLTPPQGPKGLPLGKLTTSVCLPIDYPPSGE